MGKKSQKNQDDDSLFRQVTSGVRPLSQDRVTPYKSKKKPAPIKRNHEEINISDSLLSDHAPEQVESNEELSFKRSGIQNSVMRKLRKGDFAIEAQLDLHRLIVREARELLADFLDHAGQNEFRCVRIIHGKGLGSADKLPVLKSKVNSWLRQRNDVLAFCSATRRDGGTGAVYVLLKHQ